ncbi:MAG: alginate export family protein [Nitrospirae bacterium YQR-1]
MKKLLIMAMIAILTLGFSVVVFAADDAKSDTAMVAKGDTKITIGGELRFRGSYRSNVVDQVDDGQVAYTQLNVTGYGIATPVAYDVTSIYGNRYTGVRTNGTQTLGSRVISSGDDHQSFYDTRVRVSMDVKVADTTQGFIELESNQGDTNTTDTERWGTSSAATGIAQVGNAKAGDLRLRQAWLKYYKNGVGVQIGHQLFKLGNGLFFDHTKFGDDGIRFIADPSKEWHIEVKTIKFKESTIGAPDDADAYVAEVRYRNPHWGISGDITYVDDQSFGGSTDAKVHLWNFGVRADGTWSNGLTLRGDIEAQAGNYRIASGSDAKMRGWALLAGVDYKITPPVKLTLEFAYGSGNGDEDTTNDIKYFVTSLGNDQHYTYVYEYHTPTACGGLTNSGICNTMYLKGGVAADMSKSLYGELYLYWLHASRNVAIYNGNPSGNLGWEVDAKLAYKIAKNLQYYVEGGYFFTGNSYDRVKTETFTYTNLSTANPVTTYEYTRNDAYAIRHGIQLNF